MTSNFHFDIKDHSFLEIRNTRQDHSSAEDVYILEQRQIFNTPEASSAVPRITGPRGKMSSPKLHALDVAFAFDAADARYRIDFARVRKCCMNHLP